MTVTDTSPKRQRRDRVELALASVSRLTPDEIAEFADVLRTKTPKLAASIAAELNATK